MTQKFQTETFIVNLFLPNISHFVKRKKAFGNAYYSSIVEKKKVHSLKRGKGTKRRMFVHSPSIIDDHEKKKKKWFAHFVYFCVYKVLIFLQREEFLVIDKSIFIKGCQLFLKIT